MGYVLLRLEKGSLPEILVRDIKKHCGKSWLLAVSLSTCKKQKFLGFSVQTEPVRLQRLR